MSEVSLNLVPPPLPGAPPGAGPPAAPGLPPGRGRSDAPDAPRIGGGSAENPFAALLAGFFSATQLKSTPAETPVADVVAADGLALPATSEGAATPLTPAPGMATAAIAPGKGLPPDGQALPLPATGLPGEAPLPSDDPAGLVLAPEAGLPDDLSADGLPVAGEHRPLPRPGASAADLLPAPASPAPRPDAPVLAEIRYSLASRAGESTAELPPESADLPSLGELLGTTSNPTTDGTTTSGPATERPLPLIAVAGNAAVPPAVPLPPALVALRTTGAETITSDPSLLPAPNGGSTGTTTGTGGGLPAAATALPPLPAFGDTTPWASNLGDRLLAFSGQGTHTARMKLYPEYLGELDVRLQLEDGQARVWFHTTHAQARDVLEASLPKLRELFQQSGLELVNAQVDYGQGQPGGGREQSLPQPGWLADAPAGLMPRPAAMTLPPALLASRGPDPGRRLDVLA